MPFVEYSPYFPPEELDELTAAYNVAWQFLWPATLGLTPEQISLLKKKLSQIILAAACTGERDMDRLKEIALRGMAGQANAMRSTIHGDPEECRAHALRCGELAAQATSPTVGEIFLNLAKVWIRLAVEIETAQAEAMGTTKNKPPTKPSVTGTSGA
jgi:hypothetical protein